jgi:hypothetical protein
MKTETPASKIPVSYPAPTHDEIAMAAFLAWERDGRQPGREMQYWLEAENQICTARLKKAEAAAAQSSNWPPPSRIAQVKKAAATAAQKLTTSVARGTAPKTSPVKKTTTKKSATRD